MISAHWKNTDKALRELGSVPEKVQRANVQALNRSIDQTRTLAVRAIAAQIGLPQKYIREKLWITGANKNRPEATLSASRRGVLLTRFPHRQLTKNIRGKKTAEGKAAKRNAGVQVTIKPAGRLVYAHGFLVPLGYKKTGEPIVGLAHRIPGQGRKIHVHHGPSPSQVYGSIRDDIAPEAAAAYQRQYHTALLYALRGSN